MFYLQVTALNQRSCVEDDDEEDRSSLSMLLDPVPS